MPYHRRRPTALRTNGLKGFGSKRRHHTRRARPNMSKIRYQAPTARNQKSQIMANARLLARHSRMIRTHRIWTDWQYSIEAILENNVWSCYRLTDFSTWNPVLRQDVNVARSASHTFIDRLVLNFRASLYSAASTGISVFIVSPRKNYATRDPSISPPLGVEEWITNTANPGYNVRLNSNVWKVHHARYITLTYNAFDDPLPNPPQGEAGNPFSTYRKWQVTLPCKMGITVPYQPSAGPATWKDADFNMLPFYNRYFVMIYNHTVLTAGQDAPYVAFDQLATCINSD